MVTKCLKSFGCHCMRLRQFSHSECFISQQHPHVDRPWHVWANLMSMCFLLLPRSTIRLFQTSCSFHVYKQRVEIKKERKKIWGRQTSCNADTTCSRAWDWENVPFFSDKTDWKSVILHQTWQLNAPFSVFLVRHPVCCFYKNLGSYNPRVDVFRGCVLDHLIF